MEEAQGRAGEKDADDAAPDLTDTATEEAGAQTDESAPSPQIAPSFVEEAGALIDNARNYAEAELGFQKTRAVFAGRLAGVALGLGVLAAIVLHVSFLALAVGLVIAFEPVVGIWGSIGIVFGGLLLVVGLLGWGAFTNAQKLAGLFASPDDEGEAK